jgi:hypothetical protein
VAHDRRPGRTSSDDRHRASYIHARRPRARSTTRHGRCARRTTAAAAARLGRVRPAGGATPSRYAPAGATGPSPARVFGGRSPRRPDPRTAPSAAAALRNTPMSGLGAESAKPTGKPTGAPPARRGCRPCRRERPCRPVQGVGVNLILSLMRHCAREVRTWPTDGCLAAVLDAGSRGSSMAVGTRKLSQGTTPRRGNDACENEPPALGGPCGGGAGARRAGRHPGELTARQMLDTADAVVHQVGIRSLRRSAGPQLATVVGTGEHGRGTVRDGVATSALSAQNVRDQSLFASLASPRSMESSRTRASRSPPLQRLAPFHYAALPLEPHPRRDS